MVSCWRDPLGASPGVFPRCGVLCYAKLLQLYLTLRSYRLAPQALLTLRSYRLAPQAPLSMGFSRQEYWSGLLYPSPGDLPDPRIKPTSPALQADSLPLSHWGSHTRGQTKWGTQGCGGAVAVVFGV